MDTNRDLYQFVLDLASRHAAAELTLERYLCALWSLARERRTAPSLTLAEFAALLDRAFTAPPAEPPLDAIPDGEGFVAWEHCILGQIRDLRDMAANGQLADDQRYFGIDAPRGGRWFNFDPTGYLECATVGTFDGWDGDEDGGCVLVPGKVEGSIDNPVVAIDAIDWDTFTYFLECGQIYE